MSLPRTDVMEAIMQESVNSAMQGRDPHTITVSQEEALDIMKRLGMRRSDGTPVKEEDLPALKHGDSFVLSGVPCQVVAEFPVIYTEIT